MAQMFIRVCADRDTALHEAAVQRGAGRRVEVSGPMAGVTIYDQVGTPIYPAGPGEEWYLVVGREKGILTRSRLRPAPQNSGR